MARSKAEKSKPKKSQPTAADLERKKVVRRRLANAAAVAFVAGALVAGVTWSWQTTQRLTTASKPPRVELTQRPAWMSPLLADKILAQLEPMQASSALDGEVLDDRLAILSHNPWVQQIHGIRRRYDEQSQTPGGVIEVDATFRTPAALVRHGGFFWLVDDQGTLLPDPFTPEHVRYVIRTPDGRVNLRVITGVAQQPGRAGTPWAGSDLAAGLELARLLHGLPFAEEIIEIDVSNYAGRANRTASHLELVTDKDTRIWWGRALGEDFRLAEVPTHVKLQHLEYVFQKYSRVDAGQRWIDLRFDQVAIPVDQPADAQVANSLE